MVCSEGRPNDLETDTGADPEGTGGFVEMDAGGDEGREPCCYGDNILHRREAGGSEVVDLEQQGNFSVTCGGFGARIDRLGGDLSIEGTGYAGYRCQNIAFGSAGGVGQIIYLAHHGDGWVAGPNLSVWRLDAHGGEELLDEIVDPDRLFEGIEWRKDRLFVALHEQGIQIFDTGTAGEALNLAAAVTSGFTNAVEIDLDDAGDYAFVADGAGGVRVVRVIEGEPMEIVSTIETGALARHVEWDAGRLYTALGSSGVIVHDVSDPLVPIEVGRIDTYASAQQVAVDGDLLAIAAWSHLALHDSGTLELLGTERVQDWAESEQDLAVDLSGDDIFLGEWNHSHILEYQRGLDAPDLWLSESLLDFQPDQPESKAVVIENRGKRPLVVNSISVEPPQSFATNAETPFTVEPGDKAAFEVIFNPPAPVSGEGVLLIESDDPDAAHELGGGSRTRILVRQTAGLDVGDMLTEDFGFLDVSGDVQALEGQVLVLSYFALF